MKALRFIPLLVFFLSNVLPALAQQGKAATFLLEGHRGEVNMTDFSPDGTRLVTAGQDSTARVWSTVTGRELWTFTSTAGPVNYAFFSNDGKTVLTFAGRNEIARWSVQTGKQLPSFPAKAFYEATLLPDRSGAVAIKGDTLTLYPFASTDSRAAMLAEPTNAPFDEGWKEIAYSSTASIGIAVRYRSFSIVDPNHPAGGYYRQGIELMQFTPPLGPVRDAPPNRRESLFYDGTIVVISIRPNSTEFHINSLDASHVVYDWTTWKPVKSVPKQYWGGAVYTPTGQHLITYSSNGVFILDANTMAPIDSLNISAVHVAVYNNGQDVYAVTRRDGVIALYGTVALDEPNPIHLLTDNIAMGNVMVGEYKDTVIALVRNISRQNVEVLIRTQSASDIFQIIEGGGQITLASGETHHLRIRFRPQQRERHSNPLVIEYTTSAGNQSIYVSLSGSGLVPYFQPGDVVCRSGEGKRTRPLIRFIDARSITYSGGGIQQWNTEFGIQNYEIANEDLAKLSAPERLILWNSGRDSLLTVDVATGAVTEARQFMRFSPTTVFGAYVDSGSILSRWGAVIATIDSGKVVRLWDVTYRRAIKALRIPAGSSTQLLSMSFSKDHKFVIASGTGEEISLWDVESENIVRTIRRDVSSLAANAIFSPDESIIAARIGNNSVGLWSVETGELRHTLAGHSKFISTAAFSRDGKRLLTTSNDSTVRVWNVENGSQMSVYRGHQDIVLAAQFSPDGLRVASMDASSRFLRIWDAETGDKLRSTLWHSLEKESGWREPSGYDGTLVFSEDGGRLGVASGRYVGVFGPSVAIPYIIPDIDSLDFTPTSIGTDTTVTIEIRNRGPIALELTPRIFPRSDAFTLIDGETPFTVEPNGRHLTRIRYVHSTAGEKDPASPLSSPSITAYLGFMYKDVGTIANIRLYGGEAVTTGVGRETEQNRSSRIESIAPTPSTGSTIHMAFNAAFDGRYSVYVINTLGEHVATLFNETCYAGNYSLEISITDFQPGEYFLILESANGRDVRPFTIMR